MLTKNVIAIDLAIDLAKNSKKCSASLFCKPAISVFAISVFTVRYGEMLSNKPLRLSNKPLSRQKIRQKMKEFLAKAKEFLAKAKPSISLPLSQWKGVVAMEGCCGCHYWGRMSLLGSVSSKVWTRSS
ncbi:hypothetical protein AB6D20_027505 (plasmid) [Vibrio splendidus]